MTVTINRHKSDYSAIESAVKELEDAAYKRGFQDAMNAILSAAVSKAEIAANMLSEKAKNAPRIRIQNNGTEKKSVQERTIEFIRENPGRTGAEVVSGLQNDDPSVNERTVRTAFNRLRGKEIENKNGKWYPMK